jgi:hypothetical protein
MLLGPSGPAARSDPPVLSLNKRETGFPFLSVPEPSPSRLVNYARQTETGAPEFAYWHTVCYSYDLYRIYLIYKNVFTCFTKTTPSGFEQRRRVAPQVI